MGSVASPTPSHLQEGVAREARGGFVLLGMIRRIGGADPRRQAGLTPRAQFEDGGYSAHRPSLLAHFAIYIFHSLRAQGSDFRLLAK